MFRSIVLVLLASPAVANPANPKGALDSLISADRDFSAKAATAQDVTAGLTPMFDAEVVMPVPGTGHAIGREAVVAAFRNSPSSKEGKAVWAPVRGGISADGTQGFTYGFLSLTGGDPAKRERKYLAYWIRRPEGWRVVAYRQVVRAAGDVSRAPFASGLRCRITD